MKEIRRQLPDSKFVLNCTNPMRYQLHCHHCNAPFNIPCDSITTRTDFSRTLDEISSHVLSLRHQAARERERSLAEASRGSVTDQTQEPQRPIDSAQARSQETKTHLLEQLPSKYPEWTQRIKTVFEGFEEYKIHCARCDAFFADIVIAKLTADQLHKEFRHAAKHVNMFVFKENITLLLSEYPSSNLNVSLVNEVPTITCDDCAWSHTWKPGSTDIALAEATAHLRSQSHRYRGVV